VDDTVLKDVDNIVDDAVVVDKDVLVGVDSTTN